MSRDEQLECAVHQARACRQDRKHAQAATLEMARRKEEEAIEHLPGIGARV